GTISIGAIAIAPAPPGVASAAPVNARRRRYNIVPTPVARAAASTTGTTTDKSNTRSPPLVVVASGASPTLAVGGPTWMESGADETPPTVAVALYSPRPASGTFATANPSFV